MRAFWLVAVVTFTSDQITKAIVRVLWSSPQSHHPLDALFSTFLSSAHAAGESIPVIGSAFRLSFVLNTGAAFGLLPGHRAVFVITSLLVLVAVGAYWRRTRPNMWPVVIGSALIASGALGNLVDRALFGHVTDFLDAAFLDFPVFNIADSAIVVGVGMLMIWLLFGPQDAAPESTSGAQDAPVDVPGEQL